MKQQAQLIYTHFGDEKQRLKAKEERLEFRQKKHFKYSKFKG